MVPDNSDEQLSTWLGSALRADLGSAPVDVEALVTGSRRRAQRLRSQRIAVVAVAAVLLIGVPAGLEVFRPSTGPGPTAVMLPSGSAPIARPSSPPADRSVTTPSQVPTMPPPTAGSPTPGAGELSATFAFTPAELPSGVVLDPAIARSAGLPIVAGRRCSDLTAISTADTGPLAGRQWSWSTGQATELSVNLIVTRWAPGAATTALTELVRGDGSCGWSQPQTAHQFTAAHSDQSWSSDSGSGARSYGRAVVRVGDWIAGVEVRDPAGSAAALALARNLARAQVERLITQ